MKLIKHKSLLLQKQIAFIRQTFQKYLEQDLNLLRVSAPLFVDPRTGLNDNLADNSHGVSFHIDSLNVDLQIVQSLAKWKRIALYEYGFELNTGLYTNMNAIRPKDEIDATHSIYVDQWDWEYIISKNQYNDEYLDKFVQNFYKALVKTEREVNAKFKILNNKLPDKIHIITSKELYDLFPNNPPNEREYLIAKQYGCVFIKHIGGVIENTNHVHDKRAPDYDNWKLNGDLIVYHKTNDIALELMSMGIRVDKNALITQTNKSKSQLIKTPYYEWILNDSLPLTIGGGIGQSRLCMYLLEKHHIGEVQVSYWGEELPTELIKKGIYLL